MAVLNSARMRHVCGHVGSGTDGRCKKVEGLREYYVWGAINMKMVLRCDEHKPEDAISLNSTGQ